MRVARPPSRCRRKDCKRSGRCHFVIDANGDGVCSAGIDKASTTEAALMLRFLGVLWQPHGVAPAVPARAAAGQTGIVGLIAAAPVR